MRISFFEEFPTTQNLSKLKLVPSTTKLYVAAPSLKEFEKIKFILHQHKQYRHKIKEIIYWPILAKKEGYWISPFSQRQALRRIFHELNESTTPVMLDLELPTTQNPTLYFTQAFNFFRNKRHIRKFIQDYAGKIYLAEYFPGGSVSKVVFRMLGLHYRSPKVHIIKMAYHSMHHFTEEFLRKELQDGKSEFGSRFIIAYGTIAAGIQGNEPVLSPEILARDLEIARSQGIKEVIIFRLGGMNQKYQSIIRKYST